VGGPSQPRCSSAAPRQPPEPPRHLAQPHLPLDPRTWAKKVQGTTIHDFLVRRPATLDRLRDGAYRIVLDGESHRKPRPLVEAERRKSRNRAIAAPALGQAQQDTTSTPLATEAAES
jgi:hypothetical protein